MAGVIQPTIRAIHRTEEAFLALLVALVVALGCTQIALRYFGAGTIWIDPAVRYGVLWIGFVAAGVSTRKGRHISVDALSRTLPPSTVHYTNILTDIAAATVTGLLMLAAAATFLTPDAWLLAPFSLVIPEGLWESFTDMLVGEDGVAFTVTFAGRDLFAVSEWVATSIIPVGFLVMSLRFWTRAAVGITGGEVERGGEIDEAREAGEEPAPDEAASQEQGA